MANPSTGGTGSRRSSGTDLGACRAGHPSGEPEERIDRRPRGRWGNGPARLRVEIAPPTHDGTHRWSQGDVNGDGRQDLIYPQYMGGALAIHTLLRQHNGSWVHRSDLVGPFVYNPVARNWLVADVGSPGGGPDGRADLVYRHFDDGYVPTFRLHTLLSQGDGTWARRYPAAVFDGLEARDVAHWRPADIDGDGDGDLVHVWSTDVTQLNAPDRDIRVHVIRSNGDGGWTTLGQDDDAWRGFGSTDTRNWQLMDVNGDGRTDLVHLAGSNRLLIRTLLSNGDGTWARRLSGPPGVDAADTRGWQVASINADGKADLVRLRVDGGNSELRIRGVGERPRTPK